MWQIIVDPVMPQMTIWHMRVSRWIPKATDRHLEYVIHIAFPLQQWLHERPSMLSYTYIVCLVMFMSMFLWRTYVDVSPVH